MRSNNTLTPAIQCLKRMMRRKHKLRVRTDISPIFIVGSGRSGNTLLRRILFNHPDIYIPPETYILGPSISTFRNYSSMEWPALSRLILSDFALSQDFKMFPTLLLRPLYQTLKMLPPKSRTYDNIVHNFYMYMAAQVKPGATRWGDKTPLNTFYLDRIYDAFPDARFINIVRDGYDVIESYINMGRYNTRREAAQRWASAISHCQSFKRRAPDQMYDIFFEDLVRDPEATIRPLCDFLDIEFSPALLDKPRYPEAMGDIQVKSHYSNVSHTISTSPIGKGRETLSPDTRSRIAGIISEKMAELGYDV